MDHIDAPERQGQFRMNRTVITQTLRSVMLSRGLSARQLAIHATVSPRHVQQLVLGSRTGVSETTIGALARVLDVPVDLISRIPEPRVNPERVK